MRRREEDLEEERDDEFNAEDGEVLVSERGVSGIVGFVIGVMVGVVLGASTALLIAPAKGDITRRRIRYRVRDMSDDALDRVEQIKDDAGRRFEKTRQRFERHRRKKR
ncbi:MAG: YtxH domain-containing protein [Gemmatimonadales bacterium]